MKNKLAISALCTMLAPSVLMLALFFTGSLDNIRPEHFKVSILPTNRFTMSELKPVASDELEIPAGEVTADEKVDCAYDRPRDATYGAQLVGVRKIHRLLTDKFFVTKVYFENTGNLPWFADDAACSQKFRLGTARTQDRDSIYYSKSYVDDDLALHDTGWLSANRIKMSTLRVMPGDIGEFVFYSRTPHVEDVYVEYFSPLVEGIGWVDKAEFPVHIHVGELTEDNETLELKREYLAQSMKNSDADFSGGKNIEVDISDQQMFVKIGDYTIKQFPVSSGEPGKHDTPRGNYEILFKQTVRIGGAAPHYIMPFWQAFRWDGFGLHALPSLGSASLRDKIRSYGPDEEVPVDLYYGDSLWNEAVGHLGTPVSHGCIRIGHDNAATLFEFTDSQAKAGKGTPLYIHD